jgi:uncharacterized protein YecE (DUF72 family)
LAVEFRRSSRRDDAVLTLWERYGVGYGVMSGAVLPSLLRATAPFEHVGLHGPDRDWLSAGCYSDADLGWWAARVAGTAGIRPRRLRLLQR